MTAADGGKPPSVRAIFSIAYFPRSCKMGAYLPPDGRRCPAEPHHASHGNKRRNKRRSTIDQAVCGSPGPITRLIFSSQRRINGSHTMYTFQSSWASIVFLSPWQEIRYDIFLFQGFQNRTSPGRFFPPGHISTFFRPLSTGTYPESTRTG